MSSGITTKAAGDVEGPTQAGISAEIADAHDVARADGRLARHPSIDFAPYRSSALRHPTHEHVDVDPYESDLTVQHAGEPLGERIVVTGRVLDGEGRAVRDQLVEIWQANASGRYVHKRDQHPAPLDPNFTGVGRVITGDDGSYRFVTDFTQRLVTQMYFPGDPLFALDPIYQSIPDQAARDRLVATYDHDLTQPEWATGYRWDIVLTGATSTWMEADDDGR